MSSGKIAISYVVNNSEFNTNISQMKKNLTLLQTEVKNSAKEINQYGSNLQTLGKKQESLNDAINQTKKIMDTYNTSLEKNKKTLSSNQEELSKLASKKKDITSQYKEAVKIYGEESDKAKELQQQLSEVSEEYSKMDNKVKTNKSNIVSYTTQIEKQRSTLIDLETQLENVNKEIENQSNKFLQASKTFSTAGSALESVGGKVSDLGGQLLLLSAPLIAFGTYAASVGTTFEKNMSVVQGTANLTTEEISKLSERAKELGEEIKGANATDIAASYQFLALAGQSVAEMYETIEPYTKAAIAYGEDQKLVTDLGTDSMSALGLATNQTSYYLDVLTKAQNSSNTTATQLMEAYIECGGTLKNMNVPLEESTALLGRMADQGLKGSQAGNSLNSILINLMGTTSTTEGALKKLGVESYDAEGKFKGLKNVLGDVCSSASQMTDEQSDLTLALLGGKTQITALNALLNGQSDGYDKLYDSLINAEGAMDNMYETMSNNTQGNIDEMKSKLEALGLTFSDNILPYVNKFIDKTKDLIDWFGNLSEENQQLIVDFGLITIATGGALKVIGGLTTGVGSLVTKGGKALEWASKFTKTTTVVTNSITGATKSVTVLTNGLGILSGISMTSLIAGVAGISLVLGGGALAWKEYNSIMSKTCTTAYEDLSTVEKLVATLTNTTFKTKEEMISAGEAYKNFNENVSEDFQKSAIEMREKVQALNLEIHEMNIDGVLDESEQSKLKSNVDSMCESAINAINTHYNDIQNSLSQSFNIDGILDENESTILQYYTDRQGLETSEVQRMQNEINELLRLVRDEGYVLTAEDENKIQNYYAEIARIELEAQSSNEYEKAYAQSEFQQQALNLSNEAAEKLLKSRREKFDEEIISTNSHYDGLIALVKQGYDGMNDEQKKAADLKISQYEKERSEELANSKLYYDEDIKYLEEHNANLVGKIDYYNGDLMNRKDQQCSEELTTMKTHYENINKITSDGLYQMYNSTTGTYDNLLVDIDETTGEIIGLSKLEADERGIRAGEITGYNEDIANSMEDTNKRMNQSIFDMQTNFDDYCKAVQTGTISQEDAWNRIMTDVDNGKIKISEFGFSSKEDFGKAVAALLDVAKHGGSTKDILDKLSGSDYVFNVQGNNLEETENRVMSLREALGKLNGSNVSFSVNQNNTSTGEPTLTGGLRGGLETGGTANVSGIYNINEAGVELVDTYGTDVAYTLSDAVRGEYAYLPANTHVTNAPMTTQKMNDMIDSKLSRSVGVYLNNLEKLLSKNDNSKSTNVKVSVDKLNLTDKDNKQQNLDNIVNLIKSAIK